MGLLLKLVLLSLLLLEFFCISLNRRKHILNVSFCKVLHFYGYSSELTAFNAQLIPGAELSIMVKYYAEILAP